MNRRGFLSFFGKTAAAGALAGGAKFVQAEAAPETFEYRGFVAEWTGWKQSHDTNYKVGQWLANKPNRTKEDFGVYASYPGGEGQYHDYWAFDTGVRRGQFMIESHTSPLELERAKEDAKQRLIRRIDMALTHPEPGAYHFGFEGYTPSRFGTTSSGMSSMIGDAKW